MNQAYLSAATRDAIQFDFLEQEGTWSTVAGTDTYTYTSIATAAGVSGASIGEIVKLTIDSEGYSGPLLSMTWDALEIEANSTQDDDATGIPTMWAKWGQGSGAKIRLWPSPSRVYTIGMLMRLVPAELSANGDTPLIPLHYRHSVIVSQAAALLLRQEGGGEAHNEAVFYDRAAEQAWTSMRTAHGQGRPPGFRLLKPGWDHSREAPGRNDPYWWTS